MKISLYNSQTSNKEELVPQVPGKLGIYVCGPTVYDMSHIGHARVYVAFDTIIRFLRSQGLDVTYVRNFTDIDDKIIKRAAEKGQDPFELASHFIDEFNKDMDDLGNKHADIEPRVTKHIPEIIDLISILVNKGLAYESGGDVYYAVSKFPGYGKLSGRKLEDMLAGARVEPGDKKREPMDFALWKAAKPGEPSWDSPWGKGRPGWHIECSAMSVKYLGKTLDIHGGGKDLLFPHHENELAQSEGAFDVPFCHYWMHNGFVNVDGEKMAKSLGNFSTIRDISTSYHPQAIRYFLLTTHYRAPINFTLDQVEEGEQRIKYMASTIEKAESVLAGEPEASPDFSKIDWYNTFIAAMADDFNTAQALAALSAPFKQLNELASKQGKKLKAALPQIAELYAALKKPLEILGLLQTPVKDILAGILSRRIMRRHIDVAKVEALIAERNQARADKNWAEADRLRGVLQEMGIELLDGQDKTTWEVI